MGSKSKDKSLFSELMLNKQGILAHLAYLSVILLLEYLWFLSGHLKNEKSLQRSAIMNCSLEDMLGVLVGSILHQLLILLPILLIDDLLNC